MVVCDCDGGDCDGAPGWSSWLVIVVVVCDCDGGDGDGGAGV